MAEVVFLPQPSLMFPQLTWIPFHRRQARLHLARELEEMKQELDQVSAVKAAYTLKRRASICMATKRLEQYQVIFSFPPRQSVTWW